MKIKFKKLDPNARIPEKAHEDDFCYDVFAVSEEEIAPNVWKYGLGFAIEMDNSEYDQQITTVAMRIVPRSSVYKTGMQMCNSEAVIDLGYTGPISLIFNHLFINMPRYKVGDKIAQMYVAVTEKDLDFEVVDELSYTERGEGGFGSTDKR